MKIALIGYGKMGRMIEQIAKDRGHEIVCVIDVDNQQDFDSEAFKSADVAIEFTNPTAAYGNYLKAFRHNVKVVSGSTGWMKEHGDDVRRMCSAEGGQTLFWASNFSVGVAIFSAVNRYLAKIMNGFPQYDVRMEETHHIHKLDAPSGTAITLAEEIISDVDRKKEWVKGVQRLADGSVEGSNDVAADQLAIESIRRDEVPGIHSVVYDSDADCITITHDAHSRKGFAMGAVLAAEYTKDHSGLLTISDMFKF
ncbi:MULTISPECIES: 4-hydroxy-tetrahydrodipicolinate reductase [Prevotella]|jgi:4-hydroxy-tetrahydrodipicolinate reductase|uniref:4-hydroxy-tetrahydrodipicolinate reductase n=1 Tax=Prevotella pectinovora TaxID=1602169 RepID=A0A0D0ISG2_9BACT|nr:MULTISPECIES: 4-hydroxy-tetrahydrodipicolinate reductase [Prevotella]KIP54939.1 dihydrodipicolinate reductase [Prevotella pectinovora]KIP58242.1 dihydrodipicolinate reductase [Prevotella pectinovora]KIP61097.1 dihydrodipicolinate reductase [Prevotella pectinovora]KIP61301.1 dihydrodipicolinate reductase [Prevotella pectinovora]MCI6047983.1 4-hydroxy-tetrahydrodipicolinate reductase [Prevotella pectinovora]